MKSGLGIRPELFAPVFDQRPDFGFLEAHSENYFGESIARTKLLELREHYAISLHGVGLSLGRADNLSAEHLSELKKLVNEVDPLFVSEHLAWSAYSHRHVPDLLPLPLTDNALDIMCEHIDQMQTVLGRQILLENPSNYLLFDQLQIPEPEFLNSLADRTGCGLLVDVNNIHVSATNLDRDSTAYLEKLNSDVIKQYHLAGYTQVNREVDGVAESMLIDTHNQTVFQPVWDLFSHTLEVHGARPTLFEWDSDFPEFSVILGECAKADTLLSDNGASIETPDSTTHFNSTHSTDSASVSAKSESLLANSQADFLDSIFTLESTYDNAAKHHQHRIWVYQNNVFGAAQEYLEQVYPATRGVIGADFFKQMAQRFIQSSPPPSGNIHLFGGEFVNILSEFEGLNELVYLSDLVAYEWALHSAYYSVVSDAIDPAGFDQDQLLVTDIEFNDSVTLVDSNFPIYEIHRQSLPEYEAAVAIDLSQSQDTLLVYKTGHDVVTQIVEPETLIFLQAINKSKQLLQAIESLQGSLSPDILSQALALIFNAMLLKKTSANVEH